METPIIFIWIAAWAALVFFRELWLGLGLQTAVAGAIKSAPQSAVVYFFGQIVWMSLLAFLTWASGPGTPDQLADYQSNVASIIKNVPVAVMLLTVGSIVVSNLMELIGGLLPSTPKSAIATVQGFLNLKLSASPLLAVDGKCGNRTKERVYEYLEAKNKPVGRATKVGVFLSSQTPVDYCLPDVAEDLFDTCKKCETCKTALRA